MLQLKLPLPEELPEPIRNDAKLQQYAFNISKENINEITDFVIKNWKNQPYFPIIYLCKITSLRPKNIDLYSEVIYKFITKTGSKISAFVMSRINVDIVRMLYKLGIFTSDEIQGVIYAGLHTSNFPLKEYLLLNFEVTFPPERSNLLENCLVVAKDDDYTKYGYMKNSIEYVLKYDLVDDLIPLFPIKKDNILFVNSLESGRFYLHLDLISFAAFYGSVKCFKYLAMHGAVITNETCVNAVRGGNMEIIEICEEHGFPFDKCLSEAVIFNRNDVFEWLANIKNVRPRKGRPSVYECLKYGNIQVAFYMMKMFKEVNEKDIRDKTTFQIATRFCSYEFIKWMINNCNPDISAHCSRFLLPLHNACRYGRLDVSQLLVENGNSPSYALHGKTAAFCASWSGNIELFRYIAKCAPECVSLKDSRFGANALYGAILDNDLEMVKVIVEEFGVDVNDLDGGLFGNNISRLVLAAKANFGKIVEYLLSKGADPCIETYSKESVLYYAAKNSNYYLMEKLIKMGVPLTGVELVGAAHSLETMKWLIKRGSTFQMKYNYKRSALHFAATHGSERELKFILENGIDINSQDVNERTPLIMAAFTPEVTNLQFLEIYVNEKGLERSYKNAVFLVEHGANINARDSDGMNVLWPCVKNKNAMLINYLIKKGIDVNNRDNRNRTYLEYGNDVDAAQKAIII